MTQEITKEDFEKAEELVKLYQKQEKIKALKRSKFYYVQNKEGDDKTYFLSDLEHLSKRYYQCTIAQYLRIEDVSKYVKSWFINNEYTNLIRLGTFNEEVNSFTTRIDFENLYGKVTEIKDEKLKYEYIKSIDLYNNLSMYKNGPLGDPFVNNLVDKDKVLNAREELYNSILDKYEDISKI